MVDSVDNGFRAAIHALREIVAPAVDPAHPMAREQIALVIDWLEFQRTRTPVLMDRQRAELAANLRIAREILALNLPLDAADLRPRVDAAEALLADPAAGYTDIASARADIEDSLSLAVQRAADLPTPDRDAVEQTVMRGSAPIVALQRAWFLPYGLEADPETIPALDDALFRTLSDKARDPR